MTHDDFKIQVAHHPILRPAAFTTGFPIPLGELPSPTWLTDFRSVTTAAARYQNLAINQSKLSGMCGRLKCCLNYELDTYLDACHSLDQVPVHARRVLGSWDVRGHL